MKPILKKRFNVKSIGYFGSFVHNTVSEDSDVDLLIDFTETPGWEFIRLKFFLEDYLNRPVDIVTRRALKEALRESILEDVKYI